MHPLIFKCIVLFSFVKYPSLSLKNQIKQNNQNSTPNQSELENFKVNPTGIQPTKKKSSVNST